MDRSFFLIVAVAAVSASLLRPGYGVPLPPIADTGAAVIVLYNTRVPESRQVADYYAAKRQVPSNQVFGFSLPITEAMTRPEFLANLQKPLLDQLEEQKLWTFGPASDPKDASKRRVVQSSIRYAAICYGVPTKILRDPDLVEPETASLPPEMRRNEASVDSQLACLPLVGWKAPWGGPLPNPTYATTNAAALNPTNGILLVARLDGPSAAIALGMIDKALEAETNGLWGRAYFDLRGLTTGEYKAGDDWIRGAANITRTLGFETEIDTNAETFSASYPMSHIAFYAGWYDWNASGPFARTNVEFMPGAFAYHLHSFSAQTIRSTTANWVGPLLARGATATMGCVDEPYLMGTPDIATFFGRWIYFGFSFGEAAWASQQFISWQTTVLGDPLYRPFGRKAEVVHADLKRRKSPLLAWSHLRVVGMNEALEAENDELIGYLTSIPETRGNSVLHEKLADLYLANKRLADALDTYDEVLKLPVTPQQKLRVMLKLAQKRRMFGPDQTAYDVYEQILKEFPDYTDKRPIYENLLSLAKELEKPELIEHWEKELKKLPPAASP